MPGFSFADYQSEFLKLKAFEQDLKSALYAIHPFPNDSDPSHYVVLFPSLEDGSIDYSLLNVDMMDLRLFAQVPNDLIIFAGMLLNQIKLWQKGEADYPHSFFQFPAVMEENIDLPVDDQVKESLKGREEAASELLQAALSGNKV